MSLPQLDREEARRTLGAVLPENRRSLLDGATPMPLRMMAARGLAPLPPREAVVVLVALSLDDEGTIASAAQASITSLTEKLLVPALDQGLPDPALFILRDRLLADEALLEKPLVSRDTSDAFVASVAATVGARLAEIIANNQERCLRSDAIVRALRENPNLPRAERDRLFDFLLRAGVIYDDMPEFGDALNRLSPTEMVASAEKIRLPKDLEAFCRDDDESLSIDPDQVEAELEAGEERAADRIPLLKLVTQLTVGQRIALAIKGNKEARSLLIRDKNRVVASAAVRNPRITEQEVLSAAKSRSVSDEVIRIICNTAEMSRSYSVKLALVNNPKTPLPTAMKFLTLLRSNDVRTIAKSKGIPTALANQAKRLSMAKS